MAWDRRNDERQLAERRAQLTERQAKAAERRAISDSLTAAARALRGDQQPDSDIDFLFVMEPLTWTGWMDVWNFLEESFGVEVDLVPEKDLRPELARRVLAEVRYVEGV